jgi:hypothetical protein
MRTLDQPRSPGPWEVEHGRRTGQTEQVEEVVEAGEAETAALQGVRQADPHPQRVEHRSRSSPPLLEQTPRGDASKRAVLVAGERPNEREVHGDHMGELIMVLLACTLANLRDRLNADGYDQPARVVADLVEITNDYLDPLPRQANGDEEGRPGHTRADRRYRLSVTLPLLLDELPAASVALILYV